MIFEFTYLIIFIIIIIGFILYYNRNKFISGNTKITLLHNQDLILTQDYEMKYNLQEINLKLFKCDNNLNIMFAIYPFSIENNSGWNSQYDKLKPIIRFETSPTVYYNQVDSTIHFFIKYNDPETNKYNVFETAFPILKQRWSNVLISIIDNYIKIYIDDIVFKIVKTPYIPIYSNDGMLHICEKNNNFQGKLKNIILL